MQAALRAAVRWSLGLVAELFPLTTIIVLFLMMATPDPPSCEPLKDIPFLASIRELPRAIQDQLTSNLPDLVDAGRRFQATDVGEGPRRRFIAAARAGNRWVAAYEHGGIAYHIHVVAFDYSETEGKPLLISNRTSQEPRFCGDMIARLRGETIPIDRSNVPDWNH
jgi:hypothetical protein